MTRTNNKKYVLTGAASLLALSLATGAAYAQDAQQFNIEAQPLAKALLDFNEQSGLTVAAPRTLVEDKRSPAVRGEMEPEEALEKILTGSGLKSTELSTGAYTITLASAEVGDQGSFRVAQLDQENDRGVETVADRDDEEDSPRVEDTIVVTGTNIRGARSPASPVIIFDSDDIARSGFATTQQFFQTIPQNFSGTTENVAGGLAGNAGSIAGGSGGPDLRGLGPASTLTLLDGRRIAAAGFAQFVDISMIPTSAISRIEVLTDGASAIYGSDAIAGVINIILRDDFDGAETSLRYGKLAQSDSEEYRVAQTVGKNWGSGNALASYEYYSRSELNAADRDFSNGANEPTFLLPNRARHSVFALFNQELAANVRLKSNGYYTKRDAQNSSNRFAEVNIDGTEEAYGGGLGLEYDVSDDWQIRLNGLYSRTHSTSTTDIPAFNLFFGPFNTTSDIWSIDAITDGKLVTMPGGDVQTSIGAQFRREGFADPNRQSRDVWAVFGEAIVPIISSENRIDGIEDLTLSIALRLEEYSDFGSSVDPKFGLVWRPIESLKLRGTYGTSFRAPQFDDLRPFSAFLIDVEDPMSGTGFTNAFIVTQGNPDLGPEESETFTVGFDYTPEKINGLTISLTYYDINFENRIGSPNVFLSDVLLSEDRLGPLLIRNPDTVVVQDLFDRAQMVTVDPGLTVADAQALAFVNLQNIGTTETSGFDFSVDYTHISSIGDFVFGIDGSYITDFVEVFLGGDPLQGVGLVFEPADWRTRGRVGWSHRGFAANLFVNHTSGYVDDRVDPPAAVDSWTTVDLGLSYDTDQNLTSGPLSGILLSVNAVNLFNEDPPFVDNSSNVNFDGANHNALGRFLSFQITKRW